MMNLRHIEVFHAVYVNGSVMGAARALNVSQPSISKVLAHAEDRLGFVLFRRVKGRLIATDEAHALFREANEVQGRIASLREMARNLRGGVGGSLRLAVLPALGLLAAPTAVAALLRAHPDLRVDIQTLHHDEMVRSLFERDCDLAVGYDVPGHPRLETIEVGQGELVALFRRDAWPDAPARVDLARLQREAFVTPVDSGPLGVLFSGALAARGVDLHARLSARTFYVAAGLVRAGAGVTVVDQFTAAATAGSELDYRPLDPAIGFPVRAHHLVDRPPPLLAGRFLDALRRVLGGGG